MINKKIIVGLTGQTGSGKTTACDIFKNYGFSYINCDIVARNVTADKSECCLKLSEYFPSCFDENMHLNRKALGHIVFSDKSKLLLLNDIIFPYINSEILKQIDICENKFILLDAPTLFESGADKLCDIIVSCVADKDIRISRIMKRDNISYDDALNRVNSQHDEKFFKNNSDYIIKNESTIEQMEEKVKNVAVKIKGDKNE